MSTIRFNVKGMEETLKFWTHGARPLVWEGTVGSNLVYALALHEGIRTKSGAIIVDYHVGTMLERDAKKIARGISPLTGKKLKWGKKRKAAALTGIAANLALLHTPTPEGMPGRKYLTRVLTTHFQDYLKNANRILPAAIGLMARAEAPLTDAISLVCEEYMNKTVAHIVERAADNASLWHGDLRASLMAFVGNKFVARGPRQQSLAHVKHKWTMEMLKVASAVKYGRDGELLLAVNVGDTKA